MLNELGKIVMTVSMVSYLIVVLCIGNLHEAE